MISLFRAEGPFFFSFSLSSSTAIIEVMELQDGKVLDPLLLGRKSPRKAASLGKSTLDLLKLLRLEAVTVTITIQYKEFSITSISKYPVIHHIATFGSTTYHIYDSTVVPYDYAVKGLVEAFADLTSSLKSLKTQIPTLKGFH